MDLQNGDDSAKQDGAVTRKCKPNLIKTPFPHALYNRLLCSFCLAKDQDLKWLHLLRHLALWYSLACHFLSAHNVSTISRTRNLTSVTSRSNKRNKKNLSSSEQSQLSIWISLTNTAVHFRLLTLTKLFSGLILMTALGAFFLSNMQNIWAVMYPMPHAHSSLFNLLYVYFSVVPFVEPGDTDLFFSVQLVIKCFLWQLTCSLSHLALFWCCHTMLYNDIRLFFLTHQLLWFTSSPSFSSCQLPKCARHLFCHLCILFQWCFWRLSGAGQPSMHCCKVSLLLDVAVQTMLLEVCCHCMCLLHA